MGVNWGYGHDKEELVQWSFVCDFPGYSGGDGGPLAAWVVGIVDEYASEEEILGLFSLDFPDGNPFESLVENRVCDPGDDGIHMSPYDIAPTPGRVNDGHGKCADEDFAKANEWKTLYPAYESVAIFLCRKPTDEELKLLVKRALRFHEVPTSHTWDERPKVLRYRLVREVTRIEHVELGADQPCSPFGLDGAK
jgi:hypothetical protein